MTTPTTQPTATQHPTAGPIHTWFELSYANYLVAPRARLQSMPVEWQERMVACLEELDAAYAHLDQVEYDVRTGEWVYVNELGPDVLRAIGITVDEDMDDPDSVPRYHNERGDEIQHGQRVFVPDLVDPNPHYNRGRTYLPPFGGEK